MTTSTSQSFFYIRLGELIRNARKKASISQETLSEYLGLSRISVVNIEKGKQKVQVHILIEIIKYLEIPIEDFFNKLIASTSPEINEKLEKQLNSKTSNRINDLILLKEFIKYSKSKHKE